MLNLMMVKSHQIISNCWNSKRIYDPLHSIKLQFSFTNSSMETDYSTWLRNNKLRVVKKLDNVKRFSWKGHLERTRTWKVFNWIVWSWKDINVFENFRTSTVNFKIQLYLPTLAQAFQLHFFLNFTTKIFPNAFSNYIHPVATCDRQSDVFPRWKTIAGIVYRSVIYNDLVILLENLKRILADEMIFIYF